MLADSLNPEVVVKTVWAELDPTLPAARFESITSCILRNEQLFHEEESETHLRIILEMIVRTEKLEGRIVRREQFRVELIYETGSFDTFFESSHQVYSACCYTEMTEDGAFQTIDGANKAAMIAAKALIAYRKYRAFYSNLNVPHEEISSYLPRMVS